MWWKKALRSAPSVRRRAEPRALEELFQTGRSAARHSIPDDGDTFYFYTGESSAIKLRIRDPPAPHNDGNYIVSMGNVSLAR